MPPKFWPKFGLPGILHHYNAGEHLVAFEYTAPNALRKPHTILFVGGLSDGLSTTSYTADLIRALEPTPWSLFTLTLSSSYNQWGLGHLDRDTDEIAECLTYIKAYKQHKFGSPSPKEEADAKAKGDGEDEASEPKIVLMGHSTGSQVVLHYLHRPNPHATTPVFDPSLTHPLRPVLDGAIMQAPVSDREAIHWILRTGFDGKTPAQLQAVYAELEAAMLADAKRTDQSVDVLAPLALTAGLCYSLTTPLTYRRLRSLISPGSPEKPGEDDLFSSDLSEGVLAETFGMVAERGLLKGELVVLYSGRDASVPVWVDKEGLIARWRTAAEEGARRAGREGRVWSEEWTGVIEGASHALSDADQAGPRRELCRRVLGYIKGLEGGR